MSCFECQTVPPIEDQGVMATRRLQDDGAYTVKLYPYDSKETLMELLLLDELSGGHAEGLEIMLRCGTAAEMSETLGNWLPVSVWQARLRHTNFINIIRDRRFTSHMQPILKLSDMSVYGYEMLLRPLADAAGTAEFRPYELFRAAQETGFHSFLDRAARISAIETGARHLPTGLKRFINFLPSSIYNPSYCLSHTFEAIRKLDQSPSDFVFEVVETERIVDIPKLASIFSAYKENGMKVALDDVGAGYSTLEVLTSLKPDYVKIDREWVSYCDQEPERRAGLERIVEAGRSVGAIVLAEGLERPEELEVCKEAGVDLVQGYLLGRPAAEPLAR